MSYSPSFVHNVFVDLFRGFAENEESWRAYGPNMIISRNKKEEEFVFQYASDKNWKLETK